MAVYRNKNDDTIFYGGEFKLKVSIDVIDEYGELRRTLI